MFYSLFKDDMIASEASNNSSLTPKESIPKIKTAELHPNAEPKTAEDKEKELEKQKKNEEKASSLSELIDKIIDAISQLLERTDVMIGVMMDKDSDFKKDYESAKKSNKPLPMIEITNFAYNDEPAKQARTFIKNYITQAFNDFNSIVYGAKLNSGAICEGTDAEFEERMLKQIRPAATSNIKDFNSYIKWLRVRCKGDLKRLSATSEKIPDYEKIAFLSNEALKMQTRHDKALVNKSSTTIKANLKLVSSNKNLSDETRRRADLYIKRINILLEWFRSIIDVYYNIKIQKAGTARVILRKLYKIPRK